MSNANRNRGGTKSEQPNWAAIISAIAVVGVFLLLGFMLTNTRPGNQTAGQPATPIPAPDAPDAPAAPAAQPAQPAVPNEAQSYSAPPPMTVDPAKNYTATITTPRGDIVVKLRPDVAPQTVNNFVFLAREGFYDGLTWHRVLPDFMAQGGDPTGTGMGGPGYQIPAEFSDKILFDRPGLLAMARSSDPDSAGSQFFITTAATPWLNDETGTKTNYTIFGEVVSGLEIATSIPLRDPEQNPTTPGEQMVKITISEQ